MEYADTEDPLTTTVPGISISRDHIVDNPEENNGMGEVPCRRRGGVSAAEAGGADGLPDLVLVAVTGLLRVCGRRRC